MVKGCMLNVEESETWSDKFIQHPTCWVLGITLALISRLSLLILSSENRFTPRPKPVITRLDRVIHLRKRMILDCMAFPLNI